MTGATASFDPTVERITRIVLAHCAPRRIVLYGSRARGDATADSDYDVMVEVDELPEGDLELDLIKALFDEDVDVFVTTAAEYAEHRDDVGLLPYQIEREGKLLYGRDRGVVGAAVRAPRVSEPPRGVPGSVRMWVRRAEGDFRSVGVELRHGGAPFNVCFLAHQTAEKYIKAVIICLGRVPPRTHRLGKLLDLCPDALNVKPVRDACATLLKLYRLSRYPPAREPTDSEAERAAAAADVVRQAGAALIEELSGLS
jgi:HEPN domain-containing protein/predicted nucleotidyltransferase